MRNNARFLLFLGCIALLNGSKANNLRGESPNPANEDGVQHSLWWHKANDASKHTMTTKSEICVITGNFAKEQRVMDKVMNVTKYKEKDPNLAFYFFSNLELDHSDNGWQNIQIDLEYRRMITKARFSKFMTWKLPLIEENCETVFWLDGITRPEEPRVDFVEFLHDLRTKVLSSDVGFAFALHNKVGQTIEREFEHILEKSKDIQKNVDASLAWLREQDDYHDQIPGVRSTYFMYAVSSESWRNITNNCFWKRYSLELDSWRDQPLFSYCLHHFNLSPVPLKPRGLFGEVGKGYARHRYSEEDD